MQLVEKGNNMTIKTIARNYFPNLKGALVRGIKAFEDTSPFTCVLYRNPSRIAEAALTKIEYHGTSTQAFPLMGELKTGLKLYTTPNRAVAERYSKKRKDGKGIIARVSGDMPHVQNPPVKEWEKGWNGMGGQCPNYHYLPQDANKFVDEIFEVNPKAMSGLKRVKYIFKTVFNPDKI